jgi:RNA polymerase sigma-70 factor, ECF subfamily
MAEFDPAEFVKQLTTHQSRLYAYILSLVGDPTQADDILQEANTVLWNKAAEFTPGSSFAAWMFKVAYYQVLAYRQKQGREKILFNSELVPDLAHEAAQANEQLESRQRALHHCLEKLGPRAQELVKRRYAVGAEIDAIAMQLGQTANAVKQALFRVRLNLMECVKRQLAGAETE